METVKVSIIIVNWNVRELLRANLTRLYSLPTAPSFEVIVVDNASHDGSAAMVAEDFPQVTLIRNDWDAGFAGPNNQALRIARGEVCLLLNPDMLVDPGSLERTYDALVSDRTIGVLGGRLIGSNGKPVNSVRRLPDIWSQLGILLKFEHLFPAALNHYKYSEFDYTTSQDVPQVRGSYFAFRRELLEKIGYLDDGFHIWFEEVDFCRRAVAAGLRIRYDATITAHDYVGRGVSQMKRWETQKIFSASMIRYFKKYHPWWQRALLTTARPIGLAGAAAADAWQALTRS